MYQIKMFRAVSRNGFENSVNEFLEENKDKIKEVIDIKIQSTLGKRENPDYIGTIIYKI